MVELVAAIAVHPFGDGFFHIVHEGRRHQVEAEEETEERKEEDIGNVNSALEVEIVLGRCVELDTVVHLTPGLHEDRVDIHFPADEGTQVTFEFRALYRVPGERELIKSVFTVTLCADEDGFGEVDEGAGVVCNSSG